MYKICHFTSAHKSDDVRIFHKECVSLASRDEFDVYLVSRGESREEKGVHVIGVGEPSGRVNRMTFFAKKVYERALQLDADIYHFHDPELLPYGAKLARMGKKVVFDSHENTYEQIRIKAYIPKMIRGPIATLYKSSERRWLAEMEAVIFPAEESPFRGLCKRTVCVMNTPIIDNLKMEENFQNIEKGEFKVCHVGSLTHERGITHLIKACYKAGVTLILAGNFSPEGYYEKLKSSDSFACVDYRGFANRREVDGIYRESSCGASTLLNIGQYVGLVNLPTKVYEYMAEGLPVVLSKTPYTERLIKDCRFAKLVEPDNVDEIVEAILEIKDNKKMRDEMIFVGINAARRKYNWGIDEKRLFDLYDEMLGTD